MVWRSKAWLWSAVVLIVAGIAVAVAAPRRATPDARLLAALAEQSLRSFAPRIAGVAHAPLMASRGAPDDRQRLQLLVAAGEVLAVDDADATRAKGLAALVAGDLFRAERALEAAAAQDAAAWSDLAALRLVRAEREGDPRLALDAAYAARQAIDADAAAAESRFNLALALEQLGLQDATREAFTDALAHEDDLGWRAEIRQRLARLRGGVEATAWETAREELKRACAAGDRARVAELVAAFPHQARTWGEGVDLAEWADALLAGRDAAAAAALHRARMVGAALRERSGETLLADAADAIDRAGNDRIASRRLADAHVAYREGRQARNDHDGDAAVEELTRAMTLFAEARSPMELLARYHISGARYDQNDVSGTLAGLDAVVAARPERRGYLTLHAQLGWERGLCSIVRGSYSSALETFRASRAVFAEMGEQEKTAAFEALIAEVLDYIGDDRGAWIVRAAALDALSRVGQRRRLAVTLATAAQTHVRREEWVRAKVVLDVLIGTAGDAAEPVLLSFVHAQRAIVRDALEDHRGAEEDRRTATALASRIADRRVRSRAETEVDVARAVGLRGDRPEESLALLTGALAFFERDQPAHVPRILLERGRVYARQGRLADARRDFEAGLSVVDSARRSVSDFELRALTAYWGRALFAEAIAAALAQNDPVGAFAINERGRARALLERIGASTNEALAPLTVAEIQAVLAHGVAIVEYADVPRQTIAFVIRRDVFAVVRLPASAGAIAQATRHLLVETDGEAMAAATAAGSMLLGPLRAWIGKSDQLVFVASPSLAFVPFGFLADPAGQRLLAESKVIVHAPSATLAVAAARRARHRGRAPIVSVSGDAFDRSRRPDLAPLDRTKEEALAVAALGRGSTALSDSAATHDAVLHALERAGIFHFSGHIVGTGADAQLVLTGGDGISAREIALKSLPRTSIVFLSGCTASASRAPEGVVDVATGFLVAGVPAIIATTADLDDDLAPRIVLPIHEAIRDGATPAAAIRTVAGRTGLTLTERVILSRLIVMGGVETLIH